MNVQKGYSKVTSARHVRDGSTKEVNNQAMKSAICTLTSSTPRVKKPIQGNQPKIMTPMTSYSHRGKHVASLSMIRKEKIPKIVVLPNIDKNISISSRPRPIQVSEKIPLAVSVNKEVRRVRMRSEKPQTRYVSCLHTSLSTEWKKDSLEEENEKQKKARRTASLQINLNYKITKDTETRLGSKRISPSGAANKNISRPENLQTEENTKGFSHHRNHKDTEARSYRNMNKQQVRIQYLPLRRSFTIKEPVTDVATLGTSRIKLNANGLRSRLQDNPPARIHPRILPKSHFKIKIQKSHHKSVTISDAPNFAKHRTVKGIGKEDRRVIIQDKSAFRSFSVHKAARLLSGRH